MARKKKTTKKQQTVVQSAMEVTVTFLLPITEGSEVNDINEYIDGINQGSNDVSDLTQNYYYRDQKAKAVLTTISDKVPERTPALKELGL